MVRVMSMYFRGQALDGKGNICTTGDRILMVRVMSMYFRGQDLDGKGNIHVLQGTGS